MQDSISKTLSAQGRRAFNASEIVANLAQLDGWKLSGDADDLAIEKTFSFGGWHETIAFVNAIAWIAQRADHHPDLSVHYDRCVVRLRSHDVRGISARDIDSARRIDALFA